jgi:hypothetical protein
MIGAPGRNIDFVGTISAHSNKNLPLARCSKGKTNKGKARGKTGFHGVSRVVSVWKGLTLAIGRFLVGPKGCGSWGLQGLPTLGKASFPGPKIGSCKMKK